MSAVQILDRLIWQADVLIVLACINLIAPWIGILILRRRDRTRGQT